MIIYSAYYLVDIAYVYVISDIGFITSRMSKARFSGQFFFSKTLILIIRTNTNGAPRKVADSFLRARSVTSSVISTVTVCIAWSVTVSCPELVA